MSDLDHLDHLDPRIDAAFEALARDLAHSHGPGAGAAMATARTRRRTRVGAVALAALVVVGGGLAVPRLLSTDGDGVDGVAANGGSAPLDAAALEQATTGWLAGWEPWEQYSPNGGGAHSLPACLSGEDAAGEQQPQVAGGLSRFLGNEFALASAVFAEYPDVRTAEAAQAGSFATCRGDTTMRVDGAQVRHYAEAPTEDGTSITDVWAVQIGAERLVLEIGGRAGAAPEAAVERVAQAVVAGLRSGEVQEHHSGDPNEVDPDQKPQLPAVMDSDMTRALAGWKAASRNAATTIPDVPCLAAQIDAGGVGGSGSGTPRGVTWAISGFVDETTGAANVETMLDQLRSCAEVAMSVSTVAHGVALVTYDSGGADGNGALWLHAVGDRAMATAVSGAAEPMPDGVADDVAGVMDDWLHLPWD